MRSQYLQVTLYGCTRPNAPVDNATSATTEDVVFILTERGNMMVMAGVLWLASEGATEMHNEGIG
jgi:hypothetical protein